MALSANTVFEVRTAGLDTNGGGFVTGASGSDYSMQDSKNSGGDDSSTTDAVAVGTTTITSATASFQTTIVGNIVYFAGGTGSIAAQWRQVTARASTTSITIDTAIAASTGMTMNIGGALLSPAIAAASMTIAGQSMWIKAGTYGVTTASTNVAAGCVSITSAAYVEGYNSSRGDLGTKPLIQAGNAISTFTLMSVTASRSIVRNIECDGANLTSSRAFSVRGSGYKLKAENCTNGAFVIATVCSWTGCQATGCATASPFGSGGNFLDCVAYDNTVTAFTIGGGNTATRCIADTNTGASTDGFVVSTAGGGVLANCVAYANGRDGFRATEDAVMLENCIAESNVGTGLNISGNATQLRTCAVFGNGTDTNLGSGKFVVNTGLVTGSGTFFTNAAAQDFSLNNTAGGGASARGTGHPGVLQVGGTGYLDIGALQHADPASGSGHGRYVFTNGGVDG